MNKLMEARIIEAAEYYVQNKSTIRETAKKLGVSKSTIERDLKERLKEISMSQHELAMEVMQHNKELRAIRGGHSTQLKYKGGARNGRCITKS